MLETLIPAKGETTCTARVCMHRGSPRVLPRKGFVIKTLYRPNRTHLRHSTRQASAREPRKEGGDDQIVIIIPIRSIPVPRSDPFRSIQGPRSDPLRSILVPVPIRSDPPRPNRRPRPLSNFAQLWRMGRPECSQPTIPLSRPHRSSNGKKL